MFCCQQMSPYPLLVNPSQGNHRVALRSLSECCTTFMVSIYRSMHMATQFCSCQVHLRMETWECIAPKAGQKRGFKTAETLRANVQQCSSKNDLYLCLALFPTSPHPKFTLESSRFPLFPVHLL